MKKNVGVLATGLALALALTNGVSAPVQAQERTAVSTIAVAAKAATFTSSPVPTVSGTAVVGGKLTAKTGTWSPAAQVAFQWYRGSAKIAGATKNAYTLAAADAGQKITVKVTGSKTGYTSVMKESKAIAARAATFTASPAPAISGTAVVGSNLTAKTGSWSPAAQVSFQWYRGSAMIAGATKNVYTVAKADAGQTLLVKVTGRKAGYTTVTKASKSVTAKAAPVAAPKPTVSQQNALKKAQSYLEYSSFSRAGLIDQLEYEGFSTRDATYGVDATNTNWNAQALKMAQSYLKYSSFSRSGLIDQLEYEGFSTAQAVYGVDGTKSNWNLQAVKKAQSYLKYSSFSRAGLIGQLEFEGFSAAQATYAVNAVGL